MSFAGAAFLCLAAARAQEHRVTLTPEMVVREGDIGEVAGLVDEQREIIGPPAGEPQSRWTVDTRHWKEFPFSVHLDLGRECNLSCLWLFDTHSKGDLLISAGEPGAWRQVATYDCGKYKQWAKVQLDVTTRYLRLTRQSPGAQFTEIAVYEYTPEAHAEMLARREAEAKAAAARTAALERARAEMRQRPQIDVGPPFGALSLVDEIDCAAAGAEHGFREDPAGVSRVQTILGRPCRVLGKTTGEAAYVSYRIGRMKLLMPGETYLLEVEYPEDQPRSYILMNSGNETSRGWHTGRTVGDALHPKYVNNNNESLNLPLSGRYESWQMLFRLHDRFPDVAFIRGDGERPLSPEDGFTVTVAQFSARNIPASYGAAVARIRLFAVPEPDPLTLAVRRPPQALPQRHIFWREEMADGILGSRKNSKRGITEALDWYRFKVSTMRFLGMDTFAKDLLEFGACQHWDSTDGGGNDWVYFNAEHKDLWGQIVTLMGKAGMSLLPYYEYSGSKGKNGLGPQRRCRPLTRDDAYTHIKWIESANADITDPDTYADFSKMLDLTIVRHRDKARFLGAWLRPRGQLPMSFSDAALARFAADTGRDAPVTRAQLRADAALLQAYEAWWFGKRRDFLVAMREHLQQAEVNPDPLILYTATASEPGVSFPTWEPRLVTDDVAFWKPILGHPEHREGDRQMVAFPFAEVERKGLYLDALLAAPLTWGSWEVQHGNPPADPARYRATPGVVLSHAFNRLYTVASAASLTAFRGPSGLALVRHYSLNENMIFDKRDKPKLGYFVADVERAGPYCMLAEATAMATGDPTLLGYLVGGSFSRGFPRYVRNFNQAFLALPALPSTVVSGAASDPEVVVRAITTKSFGTYLAVVNTGFVAKPAVTVRLPASGEVVDAGTGDALPVAEGRVTLSLYPCQLRALHVR